MKTHAQRRYEASLRRSRGLAHPATPTSPQRRWSIPCARTGCTEVFNTDTRQRRYCSPNCRRMVEQAAAARKNRNLKLLLFPCGAPKCENTFKPVNEHHQYCSSACRKRAHRANSNLASTKCAYCGAHLPEGSTPRRRFCDVRCRKQASRKAHQPAAPDDDHHSERKQTST